MSETQLNSNDMKGKEVVSPQGSVIGKVTAINFDPSTWRVSSLEVALDRKLAEDIGVKKRFGRTDMPLKASLVGQVGEKVLVNASREELVQYVTDLRVDETTKQIKIP